MVDCEFETHNDFMDNYLPTNTDKWATIVKEKKCRVAGNIKVNYLREGLTEIWLGLYSAIAKVDDNIFCYQQLRVRLPAVHCRDSNWTGDLTVCGGGKPSRYVTRQLDQLSLPSLWGR